MQRAVAARSGGPGLSRVGCLPVCFRWPIVRAWGLFQAARIHYLSRQFWAGAGRPSRGGKQKDGVPRFRGTVAPPALVLRRFQGFRARSVRKPVLVQIHVHRVSLLVIVPAGRLPRSAVRPVRWCALLSWATRACAGIHHPPGGKKTRSPVAGGTTNGRTGSHRDLVRPVQSLRMAPVSGAWSRDAFADRSLPPERARPRAEVDIGAVATVGAETGKLVKQTAAHKPVRMPCLHAV